ncbi:MAG TPA: hypothetical protein VFA39_15810 [Steroidobacteraceae bacterium]|nr:hypothetical protein [Steroidobacteraceae bacterium]
MSETLIANISACPYLSAELHVGTVVSLLQSRERYTATEWRQKARVILGEVLHATRALKRAHNPPLLRTVTRVSPAVWVPGWPNIDTVMCNVVAARFQRLERELRSLRRRAPLYGVRL